mmetsp:Transcript_5092/g.10873  ORF Transcript_5092/g.10873 Transcript_5092/m.10873 type:complete len:347 (-) Transcript_5092:672-1712(-)
MIAALSKSLLFPLFDCAEEESSESRRKSAKLDVLLDGLLISLAWPFALTSSRDIPLSKTFFTSPVLTSASLAESTVAHDSRLSAILLDSLRIWADTKPPPEIEWGRSPTSSPASAGRSMSSIRHEHSSLSRDSVSAVSVSASSLDAASCELSDLLLSSRFHPRKPSLSTMRDRLVASESASSLRRPFGRVMVLIGLYWQRVRELSNLLTLSPLAQARKPSESNRLDEHEPCKSFDDWSSDERSSERVLLSSWRCVIETPKSITLTLSLNPPCMLPNLPWRCALLLLRLPASPRDSPPLDLLPDSSVSLLLFSPLLSDPSSSSKLRESSIPSCSLSSPTILRLDLND